MRIAKSLTVVLLLIAVALSGCALRPPKVFRPEPPPILSITYTFAEYQDAEKKFDAGIAAGDLATAKIVRDKAIDRLKFVIENNYQQYSQGLLALRTGAALSADVAQTGFAAATNIATRTAMKNIFSAAELGVKSIAASVQNRVYLEGNPEVIVKFMDASRDPFLKQVEDCEQQDAKQCSLSQATFLLAKLFWSGSLASARGKLMEQAVRANQAQQK